MMINKWSVMKAEGVPGTSHIVVEWAKNST